jgi:hypothetical protein
MIEGDIERQEFELKKSQIQDILTKRVTELKKNN